MSDLNNDEFADILIGAPRTGVSYSSYIFFGSVSLVSKTADLADIITSQPTGNTGYFIASAGDFDKDGWKDFVMISQNYQSHSAVFLYTMNYNTSPSITLQDTLYTTSSGIFSGTAIDSGVNVGGVEYSLDGGSWTSCSASDGGFDSDNESFFCNLLDIPEGMHEIKVRSYDENFVYMPSRYYKSDRFITDFTSPMLISSKVGIEASGGKVVLDLTASDNLTEVKWMQISEYSDFSGAEWMPYSSKVEYTFRGSGGKLYIRFKDGAGNVSEVYEFTVTLPRSVQYVLQYELLGLLAIGAFIVKYCKTNSIFKRKGIKD